MPVGYYLEEDESFTNHDISLELGDTFYLFSDGFIDQKGGGENRKFMRRNFKELLLEIQEESMYEQKRILDIRLSEWMEGREQMDDILVVGVRI
jgi:serine phosphatase RsbU (regulator of sigma subunit)